MDFIKYFCCCIFEDDDVKVTNFSRVKYLDEIKEDEIKEDEIKEDEIKNILIEESDESDEKEFIFL